MANNDGSEGAEFREKHEAALAENKAMKMELALVRAGVNIESAMGKMFAQAVSNRDEFDFEQLKEEWEEIAGATPSNETPPPTPAAESQSPQVPGVSPEALESLRMSDQVGESPTVPPIQREDLTASEAAWEARKESRDAGEDDSLQAAAFFGAIMSRAAGGDPSAVWTQEAWNEKLRDAGELV
tara:strand:+ start:1134 stop:1685 length:552 start_codon:yes stop_codon:yes gene_type:complete